MSSEEERQGPPQKVRISKLQEAQIATLLELEQAVAALYYDIGFDAAEVPPRTEQDFYRLPRDHAVRVAEADHEVAGYAAWRDEAPGVAYLEELSVHPDYQRYGIGTKLLERVFEEARENDFRELVLRAWDKATWAQAFYKKAGFQPVDESAPEKVREWLALKTDGGRPFLRPGERALWVKVPVPAEDDD
jgi:amino-acid N-acetyltransferase